MPSLTVENYLKAILLISLPSEGAPVSTGELAAAAGVSPGTVTSMLKTLDESKLAKYTPYEGVVLTAVGRKLAMRILRRHRLIELFLVRTLDLPWDQIHEEAENMEHAVSDRLIERVDEFLGRPTFDPHGDPIPTAEGTLPIGSRRGMLLTQCAAGTRVKVVRVIDQGSEFLRFLSGSGISVGAVAAVESNMPEAGIVRLSFNGRRVDLGYSAADKLLVESHKG
jgi:DtxR family Mn-dependent transcriptional regulator